MSFRIRRVKWREVLQSCAITKLILILSLNHGRPRNRKLNEILELLYIKKKTIIITASNLIENTTNYSPKYPFRPEFWWEFLKNFSAIFFFVPKKCFESVFLSLISKTNTALVWRFFFRKNCTKRKSIYAPEMELLPLSAKSSNRLEDIHHTFVLHSFQNNAQCDENAGSTHAGTTVNRDWTLLTKLFLGLVNLSNEVNESFARLRNTWKSK